MDFSITTIQTDLHWENKELNCDLFSKAIQRASEKSSIIILPEMFTTGFSMNSKNMAEEMDGPSVKWMKAKAKNIQKYIVGSLIIKENYNYYNRLIVACPDGVIQHYDKKHLFSYANEHKSYSAGEQELILTIKGVRVAFFICYDLRFPVWSRNLKLKYDIAVYIANWPEKRKNHWITLLKARAIENQSYVIGVNRIGQDGNGVHYSGDSAVYNYLGEKVSKTEANEHSVENVSLDISSMEEYRTKFSAHLDADDFIIS